MMKATGYGLLLSLLMVAGAHAEPVPALPFDVPTEALTIGKVKAEFLGDGASAGDYTIVGRNYTVQSSGGLLALKQKTTEHVDYTFQDTNKTLSLKAKCAISNETKSMFGLAMSAQSTNLYSCKFKDVPNTDIGLEVVMPSVKSSVIMIPGSLLPDADPEVYKVMAGKMLYKGKYYDAVPTTLDVTHKLGRVVNGYVISREGKRIGEIDFEGKARDKGTLTAPMGEDREAVIFFGLNLLFMPDPSRRDILGG